MIISCNTIVDRRDHVQYLTVSKSYSDNCLFVLFVCLVLNDASTLVGH